MGCGHMRLLVSVARNDISELGFNQTLITRVTLYDGMSFVFVLKLSGKLLQMKDCD